MQDLFPNGVGHYVVGGLLVGAGVGIVHLMTGRIAGISSILTAVHSLWSRRPFFRQAWVIDDRQWKSVLVLGLLLGATLSAVVGDGWYVTSVQAWRLALGGVFVGFGTRLARGCTSGHGICGISAAAAPSFAATLTFVGVAMVVAQLVSLAGVRP